MHVHQEAKALIFDLDGTLSNSLPVHVNTWKKVGAFYGFRFDPLIMHELTGQPTIAFARHIISRYHLTADPEEMVKLKQKTFWDSAALLEPVREIMTIVQDYHRKLPMAVGTGASRRSAEVQLGELDLTHYFDVIVTADDVTKHKPEPETFLKCAQLLGVKSHECQVFEDGDLGIEAARRAGMIVTDVRPHINYGDWESS